MVFVANDIRYIRGEGLWNSEKLLYHCSLDSHQILHLQINVREYRKNNPEKLATKGIQDEEKQNKNTTQYVLDITIHKHIQLT